MPLSDMERELTTRQAALVDSAFEEGQYESGIATLEQLCSPTSYPSKSHLRQLLYIALYPPSLPGQHSGNHKVTQESPSKLSSRHAYSTLLPSPTASELAKRTLRVLADINSPSALLRALPAYKDPGDEEVASPTDGPGSASDADSFVASEAVRFRDCKNCWNILKSGFIPTPQDSHTGGLASSPRKRRRGESVTYDSRMGDEDPPPVVGENAWPILDWLLALFEKDEKVTEAHGRARYSPLLLSHIPPTRSESGAKWDANVPLGIVSYCFKQEDEARRMMGGRLLNLLINLTSTSLFDLPLFMNLLIPRLPSDATEMSELLTGMSATPPLCEFKLALCQHYLTRARAGNRASRGRGRPRAQPRPVTGRGRAVKQSQAATPASESQTDALPPFGSNHRSLPPTAELLHLFTSKPDADAAMNIVKYELLVTYALLQASAEKKSQDWIDMLQSGRVAEAVEEAFGNTSKDRRNSNTLRTVLLKMIPVWR
ncbi:hypothetical protein BC834DRAFT_823188 [Gloeopeniophorella convolvens]|nr:hypothetical protein BC834DRAFT_823188 [Gloeopeniophorella convolvens]